MAAQAAAAEGRMGAQAAVDAPSQGEEETRAVGAAAIRSTSVKTGRCVTCMSAFH